MKEAKDIANTTNFNEELLDLCRLLAGVDKDIDFDHLTGVLCHLSGADYGVLNIYSDNNTRFRNIAFHGEIRNIEKLIRYLGYDIRNKEWDIEKVRLGDFSGGSLTRFESLSELAAGVLPDNLCTKISSVFNLGIVYAIEIASVNKVLGDFILFFPKNADIKNSSSVTLYANMVGITLYRRFVEERIARSENNLKKFFNIGIDFNWILDFQGNIISYNNTVRERLGYSDEELIGKPVISVHPESRRDEAKRVIKGVLEGTEISCSIPLVTKSGKLIPVETFVRRGEWDGHPALFGISNDISDLKLSEEKFSRAFNTSPSIIAFSTLNDDVYVEVNQTFYDIFGYSPDEVIGKRVSDILLIDSNFRNEVVRRVQESGSVRNIETVLYSKEKKPFVFQLSAEIINIQDRDLLLTVGTDITDRLKIENELLRAKETLEETSRLAKVGFWEMDLEKNSLFLSDVTKEIAEIPYDFAADIKKIPGFYLEGRSRDRIVEIYIRVSKYCETFDEEFPVITAKGKRKWIRNIMRPVIKDGKCIQIFGIIQDITESKNAEINLQYHSDLRKLLVELSSEFINLPVSEIEPAIKKSLSRIGSFVGADRAYIFEYDFTNNTVSNTVEWCREGIEPQIMNLQNLSLAIYPDFVNAHRNGDPYIVENVADLSPGMFRKLLEEEDVLSILTIPLLSNGECRGFVGFDSVNERHFYNQDEEQLLQVYAQTLVNVSERLEKERNLISAKEKAEESDRLKSAFLANMSHEIRTPMNGILGFLNLLREPDLSEENKAAYINIVSMSGQRLLDTINDIIEISRIETGEVNINLSDINISELVGYYKGFFSQQAEKKGLTLIVTETLPEGIRYFSCDRSKLDSIISNLLKNAIKFTQSGSVELGCCLDDKNLVFYVNDTGPGIPPDKTERIFDRFVQLDFSPTRQHEGSGLGLAIVKGYTDILGGIIRVESKVGKGTRFTLSLPYIVAETDKPEFSQPENEDKPLRKGIKILIAEDDYASYLYLHKALSDSAVNIVRTLSGEDTVKCVQEDPSIVVVLMDIKLMGMTGLEAARRIREFNKTIPIIAQTAYSLYGDREIALKAGCTDYISKPVDRQELKKLLRKYSNLVR